PSERSAPISERLRESGTNVPRWTILQATRHCWPPSHPASLLLRRLFSMTKSTVQLTLGNYSPPSKLCSTLLLPPPATNLTADNFASFFTEKVAAIGKQFDQLSPSPKGATINSSSFPSFILLSESEVSKILTGSRPTTCPLDPIPSNILHAISPRVLPSITHVSNASFNSGTFPALFKVARVTPLLKKPSLDPTQVGNYRPVSLLTLLS